MRKYRAAFSDEMVTTQISQKTEVHRRPIVGVIGSGSEEWTQRSHELGCWLATIGAHLLTGGGGGVMAAVSKAFSETPSRKGLVIGILPCQSDAVTPKPKDGYPNPWVEIPITTHLPFSGTQGLEPLSRNHILVLSSDVLVMLPGGTGTLSETTLALRYERPVIAYMNNQDNVLNLPGNVLIVNSFESVKEFVRTNIPEME